MIGKRAADIAATLGVTTETIRTHEKRILTKMNVRSRAEVAHRLSSHDNTRCVKATFLFAHSPKLNETSEAV